ncbi:uncharacterized protein LOC114252289 isoform X2 [Bombyx mandarina]|uniref:Uncharacterized protein LOC114252289 isoform X2 n=1 Tax=Bombyx mandarina TaxID=7092 RepID=A0A6J2KM36_BOMMA|nr:uncharacterized protein LOC114252289 isoform X2 [Bombyx mandarina]
MRMKRERSQCKTGLLSVDELNESQRLLVKLAQMHSFSDVHYCLQNKLPLKNKNTKRVLGLNVFLDEHNIIRVGGRLGNSSSFQYEKKHPILLCDPHDFSPLTPAHFLIGRSLAAPACEDLTAATDSQLTRYHRIEQLRQHFWKRWSKKYVVELQTRTKWKTNQSDIALDTLVLIKDDNLPPLKWKLGRVIKVFPGNDGVSRVADVRTATGILRRSFAKICPLPLQPEDTEGE